MVATILVLGRARAVVGNELDESGLGMGAAEDKTLADDSQHPALLGAGKKQAADRFLSPGRPPSEGTAPVLPR